MTRRGTGIIDISANTRGLGAGPCHWPKITAELKTTALHRRRVTAVEARFAEFQDACACRCRGRDPGQHWSSARGWPAA